MDVLIIFQISLSILMAYYFIQFEKSARQWIKDYMNKLKSNRILKKETRDIKEIKLK